MSTKAPVGKTAESAKGSSEGILIIHGAIHKISIHGEPYVPGATNKCQKKLSAKNRAPTPYSHREVEHLRQEMLERIAAQSNQNSVHNTRACEDKNDANKPYTWSCGGNGNQEDIYWRQRGQDTEQIGSFIGGKRSDAEREQKYFGYKEYERSQFVKNGDSIGEQASNRLVCHPDNNSLPYPVGRQVKTIHYAVILRTITINGSYKSIVLVAVIFKMNDHKIYKGRFSQRSFQKIYKFKIV